MSWRVLLVCQSLGRTHLDREHGTEDVVRPIEHHQQLAGPITAAFLREDDQDDQVDHDADQHERLRFAATSVRPQG